jgi:hypothetical protein
MIMKKIFLFCSASAAVMLLLSACTKKIDSAYPNPNANVVQPIELIMPNIIANMAISNTAQGSLYGPQNDGQYVGRYVQFWATNTSGNQYDQMGQTTTNSTAAAADIGGSHWAMHYYGMGQNLSKVIEWGIEQKKWDYVGVAYALRAWGWLCVTDMHGEVILRQAFDPSRLVFNYDPQQDVYEEVKKDCRLAIDYLSRTGDSVSATNLAKGIQYFSYHGDVEKWKKFTYSVMARVFHRTTNKTDYKADSVIKYCNLAINDNADNAYVLFQGISSPTNSYYGPFRGNIGTFRQTKFIADLESGANGAFPGVADPRAWYIIRENPNGTFKGIREGKGVEGLTAPDQPQNYWGGAYSSTTGNNNSARYVFKDNMPWPVITAPEIQFMKAEAYYLKGFKQEALDAYTKGVSLDIDMLTTTYSASIPAGKEITPAVKSTFMANTAVVPTVAANLTLSMIMLQKYIAMYGYGILETWVDMRRYHYVDLEKNTTRQVYTDFAPPAPTDLFANNNQKLIYRVRPRYNSEFLYNIDALSTIGALALDFHTKEQWFSQP